MVNIGLSGRVAAVVSTLVFAAAPVSAAVVTVTPDNVVTAFKAAQGGDTLKFVGNFGVTRLTNASFSSVVTLSLARAHFTDTLDLMNVSNVKVSGGSFDVTGGSTYNRAIVVYNGSNISIDRVAVVGVAGQQGISIAGTTQALVSNSSFSGLQVGVNFSSVATGSVVKNKITGAVSDGIDIADSHFVTASANSCSAGNPGPGVHPDCIQLWSAAGNPLQSDIIVSGNTATGPTQGFTSFATGGGGLRIQIVRNRVDTSYPQGIACYECIDSTISYNTLSTLRGAQYRTSLNVVGGSNNRVVGNVVHEMVATGSAAPAAMFASRFAPADVDMDAAAAVASVPEPATWALLVSGFAAVGLRRRRQARIVAA